MSKDNSCKNLNELLHAEMPMLNVAFGHRRYLISKKQSKTPEEIDFEDAKKEFLEQWGAAWMEGFKLSYCNFACKKRDTCNLRKEYVSKWEQYTLKEPHTK